MKVEKVNFQTYNSAPKLRVTRGIQPNHNYQAKPNFTGGIPQADLVKDIQKLMPSSIKMINKFADSMGEISNIFINAAGTGLVAPIFIKYNPLSKTDEDTRTYSAWRQPISAVLAIATQASMVAPFNNMLNNMSNSGYLDEFYNKTNFQDEAYIKKMIKKTEKNLTSEQLEKRVAQEKAKQFQEFMDNLRNKNSILIKQHNAPTKKMDDELFKQLQIETINDMIKKDKDKLQTLDTKSEKRLIRSEYLRLQNDKAKDVLTDINTNLKNYTTLSEYKNFLNNKIKSLKAENADKELITMVQEVLDRAKDVKATDEAATALMTEMKNKVSKMLTHVNTYSNTLSDVDVAKHVEASVKNRKTALNTSIEYLTEIINDIKSESGTTVHNIEKKIAEKLKLTNIEEDCSLKSLFSEKVYNKYKSNIEGSLKGYKQFTGLVISLAVLPITCCLLNWVYPIFMDAVFPNLSNKKHDNEASALVAKAPKKDEV